MKQKLMKGLHWLAESRGLPLVALAVLGLVTVMPGWVRAQSETTTTFTSPLPSGPHGEHGGPPDEIRELLDSIIDRDEILADVLGMTVAELEAAKEAGTSIDELITEAGLDKETVRTEIKNAITEAVEQAVTDGTITQEQADLILTPPAPPQQNEGEPGHGHDHHGPSDNGHDPQATPTPTLVATAPAEGTSEATTTVEATSTAEATPAGTAAANSTGENTDRPRPPHEHQPPAQNSDTGTSDTSASDTTANTTSSDTSSSTSDNTATNNEQPSSDRPDHGGGHQRPGR